MSEQPMFEILSNVQSLERSGKKILHFELGEPDFETPDNIKTAAVSAINNNATKYAPSDGLYEFKEVIKEATLLSRGFVPSHDQILVTTGANAIIYLALKCVLNPGDEVIVPNPGFPTYFSAIKSVGGKVRSLNLSEETDFCFSIDAFKALINRRTKAIILNSPGNPTGQMLPKSLLEEVFKVAKKNHILVISDEIYSRITFADERFFSTSSCDKCAENTLVLNGFSKAFAMTGWRLGVAIGPPDLIKKMKQLNSTIVSCVPPFVQLAGIEAIEGDQKPAQDMVRTYQKRAEIMVAGFNSVNGMKCIMPKGAIYAFPSIKGTGATCVEFCKIILNECNIAATPGVCFGTNGAGFVRFSTVNSEEVIVESINRLKNLFGRS